MDIQENVSLAEHTTLKVGGPARYFTVVSSIADLESARQFALQKDVPILVLGSGSNILVRDAGFLGLVVKVEFFGRDYKIGNENKVISELGSGEILDEVVAQTVDFGYWGLENLSHIPGTIGATPVQNVGAYGVEISDLLKSVSAFNIETGEEKVFSREECQFAYRESFFKSPEGRQWVITVVTLELSTLEKPSLAYKDLAALSESGAVSQSDIRAKVIEVRSQKFPDWNVVGTAGSFFKNPIVATDIADALLARYPELPTYPVSPMETKLSLGYILDKICDLKGYKTGEVGLFENQALVLVSTSSKSAEIEALVKFVTDEVKEKTGLTIEQEVRTV